MRGIRKSTLADEVREAALPLSAGPERYDDLLKRIGDAHYVLLGEASHGTHEFYHERAEITKRLISDRGCTAVALEADWPDAYRVDRYVRGIGDDATADEALSGFKRFPQWMWRNTVVVEFVEWLRSHNASLSSSAPKTGVYGLDLYSLHTSMEAVLEYLDSVDPEAARQARRRYACFDHFGEDTQVYGFMTSTGAAKSCEDGVVAELLAFQRRVAEEVRRGSVSDDLFDAEQNARLVRNAEKYYRSMYLEEVSSWNLRDRHMTETLEQLASHLERISGRPRIAVWAHNSHIGDARATQMGKRGELNVGQLVRQQHRDDSVLIGFTTHRGTVTAASNWNAPAELKRVRPALPGSFESMFNSTGVDQFLLAWRDGDAVADELRHPQLERAIGVIYRPETERASHYFRAELADQFDAVLHFDETRAVQPLERNPEWSVGEAPETFPFAV
jgi:erythromycin esterase-like protein